MEPRLDEMLQKAGALAQEGRAAEALVVLEECMRLCPGHLPARGLRAAALVELGRFAEARAEVVQLLPLQTGYQPLLEEMLAACDAALLPPPEVAVVEPRGPGAVAVRLRCLADRRSMATNMWARRISSALQASFADRFPVRWLEESTSPRAVWVEIGPEGRLVGRVRLRQDPGQPEYLLIESTTEGLPRVATLVSKTFDRLAILAAIAGLVLWVWLLVQDWDRIWNRLSFADSRDRATKLEIFLLAIGWFLGPVLAVVPVAAIGSLIDMPFERRAQAKRLQFVRREIDPVVAAAVSAGCAAAQSEPGTRVELGLGAMT